MSGFNDRFGDTFGIIYGFTADGFTHRELRDTVEAVRSRLLLVPDVAKIEIIGAQDERIFLDFSVTELANLGIDRARLIGALQAQNVVSPSGVMRTDEEALTLRASGAFGSELDLLDVNFAVGDRMLRLGDIATVSRGYADPPQPIFRVNGEDAIGIGIAMRDGGDILALGEAIGATEGVALVDCLTLWLTNVVLAEMDAEREMVALVAAMAARTGPVVAVANEVGEGIVPTSALGRRFRDLQGVLNQRVAAAATDVVKLVAGCPLIVKPRNEPEPQL